MDTTKTLEERVRDFCRETPRLKEESGIAFHDRLLNFAREIQNSTLDACREKENVALAWIENVIENVESLAILGSAEDASNLRNNVIFPLGKAIDSLRTGGGKEV